MCAYVLVPFVLHARAPLTVIVCISEIKRPYKTRTRRRITQSNRNGLEAVYARIVCEHMIFYLEFAFFSVSRFYAHYGRFVRATQTIQLFRVLLTNCSGTRLCARIPLILFMRIWRKYSFRISFDYICDFLCEESLTHASFSCKHHAGGLVAMYIHFLHKHHSQHMTTSQSHHAQTKHSRANRACVARL